MKFDKIILTVLLVLNLILVATVGYLTYVQDGLVASLNNKVDVLIMIQRGFIDENLAEFEDAMRTNLKTILGLNSKHNKLEKKVKDFKQEQESKDNKLNKEVNDFKQEQETLLKKIQKYQEVLKDRIEQRKKIALNNVKNIKEANVLIRNMTNFSSGSGTHIRINNDDYVLTVAHLIDESLETNNLVIITDIGTKVETEIVKYNKKLDLALLKVPRLKNTAYLELADKAPKEGSEVVVIGNPAGFLDVISNGIVAQLNNEGYYLITNKIYFGNSGGCMLYKGKIAGVMSCLYSYAHMGVAQNYGGVVLLENIKAFLGDLE